MRGLVLGILAALALAGAAAAADLPTDKLNAFKPGVTTKADVEAALGQPYYSDRNPDGRSAWIYNYRIARDARKDAGQAMVVGLVFDARDVLMATRMYKDDKPRPDEVEPQPVAGFDPFDARAIGGLDWAGLESKAPWTELPVAGAANQTQPLFPYRTLKSGKTLLAGGRSDLALQVARNGSGRHRIQMTAIGGSDTYCATVRSRLSAAYGLPSATRTWSARSRGKLQMSFANDEAQWRAGGSMLTQDCETIGVADKSVYTQTLEIEPVADAPLLAPVFALDCPGLRTGRRSDTEDQGPRLVFDPRGPYVREAGGGVLAVGAFSEAELGFTLENQDVVRIDRKAGAYTVKPQQGADRRGVCQAAPLAG